VCPICSKPLTLGVLHRVEALADCKSECRAPFSYQVPLKQILAQILKCGENSKKVGNFYFSLIERLGPEFHILQGLPIPEIARADERLAAAVRDMREDRIGRVPGYDGVYGRIVLNATVPGVT
jgi:PHP family Zn ribbon phosphoesterase